MRFLITIIAAVQITSFAISQDTSCDDHFEEIAQIQIRRSMYKDAYAARRTDTFICHQVRMPRICPTWTVRMAGDVTPTSTLVKIFAMIRTMGIDSGRIVKKDHGPNSEISEW